MRLYSRDALIGLVAGLVTFLLMFAAANDGMSWLLPTIVILSVALTYWLATQNRRSLLIPVTSMLTVAGLVGLFLLAVSNTM